MTVKALCANLENIGRVPDNEALGVAVIVVTMTGHDMARIQAALGVLTDMGGVEIRNELMPLLSALESVIY